MSGRFITFEGGEGTGKSTQSIRLAARLNEMGLNAVLTREPGGSEGAEAIRDLIVHGDPERWDAGTEALLVYAARRDHLRTRIEPALKDGAWVICDRFSDSTMAYQGIAGGLGTAWISALDATAIAGRKPDLTVILDIEAETGLQRAKGRGGADRFERKGIEFHKALREAFLSIAGENPDRCVVIDARHPPDDVETQIWAAVSARFDLAGG